MSMALYPAYIFTVLLLVIHIYYLLGGLPLPTLDHTVPLDAKFTHSFFAVYCKLSVSAATAAMISYALWARPVFAFGAACIALIGIAIRRTLLPRLDEAGSQIRELGNDYVKGFRKLHGVALLLIFLQIQLLLAGVIELGRNPVG